LWHKNEITNFEPIKTIAMKKILSAIFVLAVASAVSCVETGVIRGSGVTAKKTISFSADYHGVIVSGGIKVVLSPALTDRAEIVADEMFMEYISVTQSDGGVRVSLKRNAAYESRIETVVTLPLSGHISALTVSSASELYADKVQTTESLSVHCSSAGSIEAHLVAPEIDMQISSSARYKGIVTANEVSVEMSSASLCTLAGECEILDVDASSASHFNGAELQAAKVSVDASSASSADVWATGALGVNISSAASVKYKGSPELIGTSISSGGLLKKIE
jgi:hypothetical protein